MAFGLVDDLAAYEKVAEDAAHLKKYSSLPNEEGDDGV